MQTITINSNNFSDIDTFYDEISKLLINDLTYKMGKNLDVFSDVLRGGFRVVEYDEPYNLVWLNIEKSIQELGKDTMTNIIEIIKGHQHINFSF